jgi:RNA polymerase sigma-70 factor (ECF subfamily)
MERQWRNIVERPFNENHPAAFSPTMVKEVVLTLAPSSPQGSRDERARLHDLSDDDLMKLVATNAAEAFRELVGRYQRRVIAICVRSTGTADEGREIAQDVFLSLWEAAPRYVPRGTFSSFLFTIVRNELRSVARRRGRERATADAVANVPRVEGQSLEHLLAAEDERRLGQALQALPAVHRQAILLRFTAGLPFDQIAALCEAPQGTVRSWVHHGIKKLRALIGERS